MKPHEATWRRFKLATYQIAIIAINKFHHKHTAEHGRHNASHRDESGCSLGFMRLPLWGGKLQDCSSQPRSYGCCTSFLRGKGASQKTIAKRRWLLKERTSSIVFSQENSSSEGIQKIDSFFGREQFSWQRTAWQKGILQASFFAKDLQESPSICRLNQLRSQQTKSQNSQRIQCRPETLMSWTQAHLNSMKFFQLNKAKLMPLA